MKPTLLMNVGTSFSASSPLHYTLGWDNKYCHTGHTKEHQYLYITQVGRKAWGRRNAAKKREKRRREEIEQGGFTSKPDVLTGEHPLIKNKFDVTDFYKGDYFKSSKIKDLNCLIYPLPTSLSLGIHAILNLNGGVVFGPNAYKVKKINYETNSEYKNIFKNEISKILDFEIRL